MPSRNQPSVAILVYGKSDADWNAFTEEKYKDLGIAFTNRGFNTQSVVFNVNLSAELAGSLQEFDAILVWVNPIEQGNDRKKLDELLTKVSSNGRLISTHPEVILKMGTKDILFKTKNMDWGGDTEMYTSFEHFKNSFPAKLHSSNIRVLKQYRGNGGNGVFKITSHVDGKISITRAIAGDQTRIISIEELIEEFKPCFNYNGLLIDQEWSKGISNGMVRCYVSGTKCAGFGYQEINALYELPGTNIHIPPGKRYYYTENCGLFKDLKEIMESKWIPEMMAKLSIEEDMMPVIWDADFFINDPNSSAPKGKYTLCEINVSCVSPFPPSAVNFIVAEVERRLLKL